MSPSTKEQADPTLARLDAVARRLDAIIALLIRSPTPSMSDQIRALGDMGFDNPAIGRIVGRDAGYIATVRGRKRSVGKTAGKKRGAAKKAKKK
jgi:hypothetical protein